MINIIKRNLYILFSFVFFLFAGAFTLMPEAEGSSLFIAANGCPSNCCTCDGPSCIDAQYCGITGTCIPVEPTCYRPNGELCGECSC